MRSPEAWLASSVCTLLYSILCVVIAIVSESIEIGLVAIVGIVVSGASFQVYRMIPDQD